MVSGARERLAGLAATVALAVLVVGPPMALVVSVGWPLPRGVPAFDEVVESARRGVDDLVVVKALALVAWLAWIQIAVAVAVEAAAAARGAVAGRASVMPGVQVWVARLVATATMLLASLTPPRPVVAAAGWPAPAATAPVLAYSSVEELAVPGGLAALPMTPSSTVGDDPHHPRYEVRRRDTLWGIAERTLGNGARYGEVRDLNAGRAMGDGGAFPVQGDPIQPGWILRLPADADLGAAGVLPRGALPTAPAAPVAGTVTVSTGDHLWGIAAEQVGQTLGHEPRSGDVRPYWLDLIAANRDRLADPDNPALVYAGQELVLPPPPGGSHNGTPAAWPTSPLQEVPPLAPAGQPVSPSSSGNAPGSSNPPITIDGGVTEAPTSTPGLREPVPANNDHRSVPNGDDADTAPTTPGSDHTTAAPGATTSRKPESRASDGADGTARDEAGRDGPADGGAVTVGVGILGVAGTGIAVGVGAALHRRRRRRLRDLPSGVLPPDLPAEFDGIRTAIHLDADHDAHDLMIAALRHLAASLTRRHAPPVRPRIVQVSSRAVEVFLTEPAVPAPSGWRPEASGAVWVWTRDVAGVEEGMTTVDPAPALVSLGVPEPTRQSYLDLEAEGVVALRGGPDASAGLALSIVLELAHATWGDGLSVVVVGDLGDSSVAALDRVRAAEQWDDVAADVRAWVDQSGDVLAANRWPNSFMARAAGPTNDALSPLVVVLADPPVDSTSFAAVCEAVLGGASTVALVVVGGDSVPGATVVEIDGAELRVPSLDLVCEAQQVDSAAVAGVVELLADAERSPTQLRLVGDIEAPGTSGAPGAPRFLASSDDTYHDPEHEVLVRVLGDIDVVGGNRPLSPKQTAVAVYIALHEPVASERVEDAIWTTPTVSRRKRLANTVSECRGALGARHLPLVADGRYTTGPGVRTDLDLFARRAAYAATRPGPEAIETLRDALDLVRGPVFVYRNIDRASYVWVDLENWLATWELKVADVALTLADLCLDEGDTDGAILAAERGLLASPTHTTLTEALMRGYAQRGDRVAVERVFHSHVASLEQLQIDDVADSTIEAHRSACARAARVSTA